MTDLTFYFGSVQLLVDTGDHEMKAYFGENETAVHEEYQAAQGWFTLPTPKLNLGTWGPPFSFKLYDQSCIGLHSRAPYVVEVIQQRRLML